MKKPDFSKVKDKLESLTEKLKGTDNIEEENDWEGVKLDPEDLKALQSDLAQFKSELSETTSEKIEWEAIKPKAVEKPAVFNRVENYWLISFISVIKLLLKSQDFKIIFKQLRQPHNMKNAILKRLYDKIKSSKPVDYDIYILE